MSALTWATSWRAALRISRREVLRNRSRNLLIVAMLALPVFGMTTIETILNSAQDLTPQERLTRVVGAADAYISATQGTAIYQTPDADPRSQQVDFAQNAPTPTAAQLTSVTAIRAVLPGVTLLAVDSANGVFAHGPGGYATPEYYQLDLANPAVNGAFDVTAGRAPRSANEIDLSPAAAKAVGVSVGGTVTVPGSSLHDGRAATFTVVGLVRQPTSATAQAIYALPGAPTAIGEGREGWFAVNPGGVSWSQVEQLNKSGYCVTSRAVVLHPPARSQVPYYAEDTRYGYGFTPRPTDAEIAIVVIVVGIALLEVVLLAGPAFAVSARRREREYAMLGAIGADDAQVRRVVLADGVVLGAIAGVLGALVGYGAGAVVLAVLAQHTSVIPGTVHVDVSRVAAVAALSVLLGLCAALVPAASVARRDVMSALNGRRSAVARRVRVGRVVLGVLLIGAGLVAEYHFARNSYSTGAVEIVGGIALVEIGGILCTPAVIRLVARCGGLLPLGPRLALRDGARNSSRTTPAVAAMFAAVAGAVAAGAWIDSGLAQERAGYQPSMLSNQAALVGVLDAKQATEMVGKLKLVLPLTGSTLIQSTGYPGVPDSWQVAFSPPGVDDSPCPEATNGGTTTVCGTAEYGGATVQNAVGDGQAFREVTGLDDPRAEAVLDQGGVVLFGQGPIVNGKTTIVIPADGKRIKHTEKATVPAVYVDSQGVPSPGYFIGTKTAQALGIADGTRTLLLDLSGRMTASQQFAADQVLDGYGYADGLVQDDGLHTAYGLANTAVLAVAMLVAMAAAAIATGLALADGRADQETLAAVGGSPWTRRWLAASTALVITGLGVLIGVPVGFLIAFGLIRVSNLAQIDTAIGSFSIYGTQRVFVVPWLDLGALAVAVPLLTALGAALLSRSRAHGSGRALG
ncbi:MAG TPA: ABC transporter permease [Actinospica sp.]|nr:ABC transporter permease [Actinospica sp.]